MTPAPSSSHVFPGACRLTRLAKQGLKWGAWRAGLLPLLERACASTGDDRLVILTYHHISAAGSKPHDNPFEGGVRADEFESHIRFLASRWRVMDLAQATRRLIGGEPLPKRAVCLTFDDGYMDVYAHAYPVLRRYDVPATAFVSTGYADTDELPWWAHLSRLIMTTREPAVDVRRLPQLNNNRLRREVSLPLGTRQDRLASLTTLTEAMKHVASLAHPAILAQLARRLNVTLRETAPNVWMRWEHIRELSRNGITIGAHTIHHPNLALLDVVEQRAEIVGAKRRLQQILRRPVDLFSYPFGLFDDNARAIVAQEFTAACGSTHGANGPRTDRFALRRISMGWHRRWDFAFTLAFPGADAAPPGDGG